MLLSSEVDLGAGDILLDVDPAAPRGHSPFTFRPMSIMARRLHGSRCLFLQR